MIDEYYFEKDDPDPLINIDDLIEKEKYNEFTFPIGLGLNEAGVNDEDDDDDKDFAFPLLD